MLLSARTQATCLPLCSFRDAGDLAFHALDCLSTQLALQVRAEAVARSAGVVDQGQSGCALWVQGVR